MARSKKELIQMGLENAMRQHRIISESIAFLKFELLSTKVENRLAYIKVEHEIDYLNRYKDRINKDVIDILNLPPIEDYEYPDFIKVMYN